MPLAAARTGGMMRYRSSLKPRHPDKGRMRLARIVVICLIAIGILALAITNAARLNLLGHAPVRIFPSARGKPTAVTAVFLSGDMGFDFGLSGRVAMGLAAHGIPVIGIVSPVVFANHLTQKQATAVVEQAIWRALGGRRDGRVVLVGESFGADILATVAPRLPPALLERVDTILLTVPSPDVYFRADPSGLAYMGEADAHPLAALGRLNGPPIVCIYGVEEPDSLCPKLGPAAARVIALPGGHYLNHDPARLIATTFDSLQKIVAGPHH